MSAIVLDALKALGPRPALRAAALRKSCDPEVLALFGLSAPISEREAWERLKDLALGADLSGFTALDLFTEVTSPGAHAQVLARGWPIETPDPRAPVVKDRSVSNEAPRPGSEVDATVGSPDRASRAPQSGDAQPPKPAVSPWSDRAG